MACPNDALTYVDDREWQATMVEVRGKKQAAVNVGKGKEERRKLGQEGKEKKGRRAF